MPKYGKVRSKIEFVPVKRESFVKCNECEFQTNSPSAFRLHKKFIHKKIAEPEGYKCCVCFELFKTHKEMNKHSMTHKVSFK